MTDLRAFLRRHIEAFLDHEFGPEGQNMTPSGIRRILWTSDHTNRLVHHLVGNWEMVEEAEWDGTFGDKKPFVMREVQRGATPEDDKPPVNREVPW